MSRLPPVLEMQPRVVGVAWRSKPRMPQSMPSRLKASTITTMQHSVMQATHLSKGPRVTHPTNFEPITTYERESPRFVLHSLWCGKSIK